MSNIDFARLFDSISQSFNMPRTSAAAKSAAKRKRRRTCRIEELENREMLSADLFNAITDAYPDLELGNNWALYKYHELHPTAPEGYNPVITAYDLQEKINEAQHTTIDDIIHNSPPGCFCCAILPVAIKASHRYQLDKYQRCNIGHFIC